MPIYSFVCDKCKNLFKVEATMAEWEKKTSKKFSCPKCGSKKISQQIEPFFNSSGCSGSCSSCPSCGL